MQVVISTGIDIYCLGIYLHIDTGTRLIPLFVIKEDQYFKKLTNLTKHKWKNSNRCE